MNVGELKSILGAAADDSEIVIETGDRWRTVESVFLFIDADQNRKLIVSPYAAPVHLNHGGRVN